jgi:hypothetical protein
MNSCLYYSVIQIRDLIVKIWEKCSILIFLFFPQGEKLTEHLKLRPLVSDYDSNYDKEVDAGISNEFSTAAYRFGHSMLQVYYFIIYIQDIQFSLL